MTVCWGITSGSAGMEVQVRALASALGMEPQMKTIRVRRSFVWLPNVCFTGFLARFVVPYFLGDPLNGTWPQLVITCGRRAAIVALGMKAFAKTHGFAPPRFIHIQDPHVNPRHFDLIVAMAHDDISGPNVIKTRAALHTITKASLEEARQKYARHFTSYMPPYVAVMLGGSTNKYTFTPAGMEQVIGEIKKLLQYTTGSLLMTPSRRTGDNNIAMLHAAFDGNERVYIYGGMGDNPYMGLLALADYVVVTNDSVNMISEACATGKPVYLLPLPGHDNTKPARFAEHLLKEGTARLLKGRLEPWSYPASNEMEEIAGEVRRLLVF